MGKNLTVTTTKSCVVIMCGIFQTLIISYFIISKNVVRKMKKKN